MAKAKKGTEMQDQMDIFLAKLNTMVDVMSDRIESMAAQEKALKEHEKTLASLTDRALEAIDLFKTDEVEQSLAKIKDAELRRKALSVQLDSDQAKMTRLQEKQASLKELFGSSGRVEL